ncbi:MAG: radical SAM protein [Mariprofundus sp.]|nr:radical SAM protein [Mariprofundus sp.]
MSRQLSTRNHDRDTVGMTYVYPVVSRRAGGVSVGINLNTNNACNWHCAYCQVPNLIRGVAPEVDLKLLRTELITMLDDIVHGSFMSQCIPKTCRKLCDVAISGNGEPTSSAAFDQVVTLLVDVMQQFGLSIPLRLITNGSYVHKPHVQKGLVYMAKHHGEVWIKLDSVTDAGIQRINGIKLDAERLCQQIVAAAEICPTWLQTCMAAWDGQPPTEHELTAYIGFLEKLKRDEVPVQGILLYGLARPSLQQEAIHLSALDEVWMQITAERIRQIGVKVTLSL